MRRACLAQLDMVHRTACIAPMLLVCKRSNEMDWIRACIAQLDMVHRTACIPPIPLVCKRSNELNWIRACIAQLDTVHGTACIAPIPLVCKRSNEMDMRRACIAQLDTYTEWLALCIHRWCGRRATILIEAWDVAILLRPDVCGQKREIAEFAQKTRTTLWPLASSGKRLYCCRRHRLRSSSQCHYLNPLISSETDSPLANLQNFGD